METVQSGEDRSVNKLKAADKAFLEKAAVITERINIIKGNLLFSRTIEKVS